MDIFQKRYGSWAFIAGAAEGIGAGFAEVLASRGMNLIAADINEEAIRKTVQSIKEKYQVDVKSVIIDLSQEDAWKVCMDSVMKEDCRLIVYNTAYSVVKRFTSLTHDQLDRFEDINNRTMLHLVNAFAGNLLSNQRSGGIILMSSLAGLVGPRFVVPYAGTKGFMNLFGEGLHQELKKDGIDVTVCCAGTTMTPTFQQSNPNLAGMKPAIMQPREVAEYAVKNLGRKAMCIAGWSNRLEYFLLTRLLPRKISARIVSYAMGKIYPNV